MFWGIAIVLLRPEADILIFIMLLPYKDFMDLGEKYAYSSYTSMPRHIRTRLNKLVKRSKRQVCWLFTFVWRRLMLGTTVIAVTGSVGKSTMKECLASILATQGATLRTRANQNDIAGIPRTLRAIRPWHRFAVIEVGTHAPGVIRRLGLLVRPDIAVVLSVAHTHTNAFVTLEDTAAEKAKLLDCLPRHGIAVLNGDDVRVRAMAERCRARVVLFGRSTDCDLVAGDVISRWPARLKFTVDTGGEHVQVRTQLVGTHWLGSALGALAAATTCGVPLASATSALSNVPPFTARMQPVTLPNGAVVIRDEENGSRDTLDAMLEVMRTAKATRRILLIGDLTDVKGNPRKRQRDIGKIAAELCDIAVFVDKYGHHAVRGAVNAGMDPASCYHIPSLEGAVELLRRQLRDGDLVFVKSRATDHLSRVVFAQFGPIGCRETSCRIRSVCDLCTRLQPGFDLDCVLAGSSNPSERQSPVSGPN